MIGRWRAAARRGEAWAFWAPLALLWLVGMLVIGIRNGWS